MRKTIIITVILTFLLILIFAVNSYAVVSDLKIQGAEKVKEGETIQLEAIYNSYNDDNPTEKIEDNTNVTKKALWLSSDETVATVDENGVVTAVSKGIVKITADYEVPAIHELNVLGKNGEEPVMVPPEEEENTVVENKTQTKNTTVTNNTTTNTNNTTKSIGSRDTRYYLFLAVLILCILTLLLLVISSIVRIVKKDDDDDLKL